MRRPHRLGGLAAPRVERVKCIHRRGHGVPASWSPSEEPATGNHLVRDCHGDLVETEQDWKRAIRERQAVSEAHRHDFAQYGAIRPEPQ